MNKDFTDWHQYKHWLHHEHPLPTFRQREIWWCSVGVNVGHEVDGKSARFNRPVLIVRKFNPHIFLGVPLTTQRKDNPFYHPIQLKDREQCVMLSQLRLWSGHRLTHKMGKLPKTQFEDIREALRGMI